MLGPIFQLLIGALSPQIKTLLHDFIRSLYAKALATSNVFDDGGVWLIAMVLGVDLMGVVPAAPAAGIVPQTMSPAIKTMLYNASFPVAVSTEPVDTTADIGGFPTGKIDSP